jgi:hypothetical protein
MNEMRNSKGIENNLFFFLLCGFELAAHLTNFILKLLNKDCL